MKTGTSAWYKNADGSYIKKTRLRILRARTQITWIRTLLWITDDDKPVMKYGPITVVLLALTVAAVAIGISR